jgi:hypothetical protein
MQTRAAGFPLILSPALSASRDGAEGGCQRAAAAPRTSVAFAARLLPET